MHKRRLVKLPVHRRRRAKRKLSSHIIEQSQPKHCKICESLGVQFPRATRLYLKIDGRMVHPWRAVEAEGEMFDVLVQTRRNKRAALKLMRKLLKQYGFVPDKLVTDDLRSYGAPANDLGIAKRHERGR
jgi:transposase-like protein